MIIRPAQTADLKSLLMLVRAARRHMASRGIYQWDEIYPNEATLQEDIRKRHLQIIANGGRIAGMIVLDEEQPPEYGAVLWKNAGRVLVVHRLTIDPQRQRQNLATRLMEFAETTAATKGYDAIRLDAFTGNPGAMAFYDRLGYRKAGTVRFRKGLFCCYEKQMKK